MSWRSFQCMVSRSDRRHGVAVWFALSIFHSPSTCISTYLPWILYCSSWQSVPLCAPKRDCHRRAWKPTVEYLGERVEMRYWWTRYMEMGCISRWPPLVGCIAGSRTPLHSPIMTWQVLLPIDWIRETWMGSNLAVLPQRPCFGIR